MCVSHDALLASSHIHFVLFLVGKTSNFAVVPARLIVDKKDHGIQMFIVQLRDRQTHQPLPGKVTFKIVLK